MPNPNQTLDQKINEYFPGLVVRKDLVKAVKGNAIVPSYVLEYLLGQYCATNDEASIANRHQHRQRNPPQALRPPQRSRTRPLQHQRKGRYKVIDKISVSLNDKTDVYEAEFANLGIKKLIVDSATVKAHPKLLSAAYGASPMWNTNSLKIKTLVPGCFLLSSPSSFLTSTLKTM